jgi:hypothetical protein
MALLHTRAWPCYSPCSCSAAGGVAVGANRLPKPPQHGTISPYKHKSSHALRCRLPAICRRPFLLLGPCRVRGTLQRARPCHSLSSRWLTAAGTTATMAARGERWSQLSRCVTTRLLGYRPGSKERFCLELRCMVKPCGVCAV